MAASITAHLPTGSAAVIASVPPAYCPHQGDTPNMVSSMQKAAQTAYCIVVLAPDRHTERMMNELNDEIGVGSESSKKGLVTKCPGTGAGRYTIQSPIELYRIHTSTGRATTKYDHPAESVGAKLKFGGMFFDESIRAIVPLELGRHLTIHPKVLMHVMPHSLQNLELLGIVSDYLTAPLLENISASQPTVSAAVVKHSSSCDSKKVY